MTTTARPAPGQPRVRPPRVLLVAGLCVVGAVVLATLAGALWSGSPGALGALTGGGIACLFFLFGSIVVSAAIRVAPQIAMMVALLTYTLQVVLIAVVFAQLVRSDALGTTLSAGWLAGGIAAATVAWTVGQLFASTRARIPAYDIDLPEPSRGPVEPSAGTPSRTREVGAP